MKKDRKIFIVIGLVAVILVSFLIWCSAEAPDLRTIFTFTCAKGKTVQAIFIPEAVSLKFSDNRSMVLKQKMSASGARYANLDESVVFWNKGNTAFIEERGVATFTDCITK
jgi:membrane-bound inhibitor of C-type lysozyme